MMNKDCQMLVGLGQMSPKPIVVMLMKLKRFIRYKINAIILPKIHCRIQRHIIEKYMKKYASKNGVQQNYWTDYGYRQALNVLFKNVLKTIRKYFVKLQLNLLLPFASMKSNRSNTIRQIIRRI